jgi:pimeloyl-ACP methyl ester carboxylesterase
VTRIFVPGFGARASFYRAALGARWTIVEPTPFDALDAHVDALAARLRLVPEPITLGGHSMGAAVAVLAALREPQFVARLVLVAPAGLPLTKPVSASLREFVAQAAGGVYGGRELVAAVAAAVRAPRAARRLAREVRRLDLRAELGVLGELGIACDVVACSGDTLTPVGHCRRIAELAGARYRELRAAGGHMWLVVEPRAFAGLVPDQPSS